MRALAPRIGDVVRLANRRRLKCVRCTRYMPFGESPTCGSCGASYTEVADGVYRLES